MNTAVKGRKGEDCAAAFLSKRGYTLVKRNYRHREGEIDIIAEQGDFLVFVEVKTWDALFEKDLEYAVTAEKMRRIIKTARYFLIKNSGFTDKLIRFDLMLVTGNCTRIKHIENAFSEV